MAEIAIASSSMTGAGSEQSAMTFDLTEASDAAVVVAIGRWREDALAEAYRRHAGAVFALATRVVGDRNRGEEITQEVFLRLWDGPARFDPERGSLRSFLLADCHGRAVDFVRSESARRTREERDHARQAEGDYDLEREVWDIVVAERVRNALDDLPDTERKAIELAYFGGKTYREVATTLGEPEGTVKTRIRAGLRRLRAGLEQPGVGELT